SLGAAEAGLHVLNQTPPLRGGRVACDTRRGPELLFGEDRGYTPALFTWDRSRVWLEERAHPDGAATLAVTALERRLLPLVRYDLEDEGRIIGADRLNDVLTRLGSPVRVEEPAVAVFGRRSSCLEGDGWSVRPEAIKESLFAIAAHAGTLTGRFRIVAEGGAPRVHVQLRDGARPTPRLADHLTDIAAAATDAPVTVRLHTYRDYPYHDGGDFQRKPRYL
ncbi:MAG TPA: hypothetical protein PKE32_07715, partial [Miltoncostaeaceae bacterium]|nr:hypothetical protein [Miltoncostaeaceae bacterium]